MRARVCQLRIIPERVVAVLGFNSETPLEITYLSIELLKVPERDSRFYRSPQLLRDMELSIKDHGILVPLAVTPYQDTHFFVIIDGSTRYIVASGLGITELPCIIYYNLSRQQYLVLRGKMNIQRGAYDPVAIARDMWELKHDFGMSYSRIAREYNFSKAWVSQLMVLNRCSADVRLAVSRGETTIYEAYQQQRQLERGAVAERLRAQKPEQMSAQVVRCEGCKRVMEYFMHYQRPVLCRECLGIAFDAIHACKPKRASTLPVKSSELYRTDKSFTE